MKCLQCNTETSNPKFCSRSCSASYTNTHQPKRKKSLIQCCVPGCANPARWGKRSRCETHYLDYLTRKEVKGNTPIGDFRKKESVSKDRSWVNVHIRQFARIHFKHLTEMPCANCGYDKHVELCHIQPISSFPDSATVFEVNATDNIIQLCPNCHWELDHGLLNISFCKRTQSFLNLTTFTILFLEQCS